jgi:hypothetical protein
MYFLINEKNGFEATVMLNEPISDKDAIIVVKLLSGAKEVFNDSTNFKLTVK